MKIKYSHYLLFFKILVSTLLVLDAVYGLVLGSVNSLIRCAGHVALIILLMIEHRDIKFVINLWAVVLLILLPMIYPGIAFMYLISDNSAAIDLNKLLVKFAWILLGLGIVLFNNSKKVVLTE